MRTVLTAFLAAGVILALTVPSAFCATAKPSTPASSKPQPPPKQPAILTAVGEGAMPTAEEQPNRAKAYLQAKSYAQAQAVANLIRDARGTSITYRATGKDYAMDEQLSQEISGMVEHVKTVSERKIQIGKDTVVEVTVQAPMPERWQDVAAGKSTGALSGAGPAWTVASAAPFIPAPSSFRKAKEAPYTSLIIDTLGLGVIRAMSPKILRTDGTEVWGTLKTSYEFIADHGIVAYARTLGEAYTNARAGDNPLVVRALRRGASNFSCDVVLSDDDADYLLSENQRSGFLKDFRVLFLVDGGR